MSDFEKIHANILQTAMRRLKDGGELLPVGILCIEKTRSINTVPMPWQNDADKRKMVTAMGMTAHLTHADYCFIVSDACIAEGSVEDYEAGKLDRPTERPLDDRREVVIVWGVHITDAMRINIRITEYRRSGPKRDQIRFLPEAFKEKPAGFGGEFVDFFKTGFELAQGIDDLGQRPKRQAPDGPAA